MPPPSRIAVIGAGAAGLAATKALLDAGLEPVAYDKGDRPGGLWARDNSSGLSPAYASLHLNTSKKRTQFADFPMPGHWPDYPSADRVAGYLADYARTFDLTDRIRFGRTVTSVTRDEPGPDPGAPGPWIVRTDTQETDHYDAVIVANGHNWDPRHPTPQPPGTFAGTQIHAHAYRTPETFRGRRVLVVGMGNSAMDIATDAAHTARGPVLLSARRGTHIVPKYLFGRPADATGAVLGVLPWRLRQHLAHRLLRLAVGPPQRYGLPAPAGGLLQDHPTVSDTIWHHLTHGEIAPRSGIARFDQDHVVFTDGTRDPVDLVVWATGYRVTIPFLATEWTGRNPEQLPLYQRVFHLRDPNLMFVGLMQSTGAALPVVEAQSKLAAAYLAGTYTLPDPRQQQRAVARALAAATRRWGDRRPHMRIDIDRYLPAVSRELTAGTRRTARPSLPARRKEYVR